MKVSELVTSSTHRTLIYGAPKTGKSLIAAKLAEYFKLYWVDLENGYEVMFQLPEEWQENIEIYRIPDTRDYSMGIETCLKISKGGKVNICDEHGKVSCMLCTKDSKPMSELDINEIRNNGGILVFDSLTQLTNSAIANITKNQSEDYKLQFDDYLALGGLLDRFLSRLQQARYNVIVITHETEAEKGKKNLIVPVGGTRNFSRNVAKYFDHVVYCEKKNKKHVFSSASTAHTTITTGSRTGVDLQSMKLASDSLLPIYRPDLFPTAQNKISPVVIGSENNRQLNSPTKTGGTNAKAILTKLQQKS